MRLMNWIAIALGALLISGCAYMDPEEREFMSRNVLHPGMDADERAFWYSGWRKPGMMDQ